jgi:hypothetical protein
MTRLRIALAVAAAAVAGGGTLALAVSSGADVPGALPSTPAAVTSAEALTRAPAADHTAPDAVPAADARAEAALRGLGVPLPAGGTFNGVRWELAVGDIGTSELDGVLEYNAACQWLRAWRDGREAAVAVSVLATAPEWPAMRGTESGAVLAKLAAETAAGGGETATAVLRDCDAGHAREVEYARSLGLPPSS